MENQLNETNGATSVVTGEDLSQPEIEVSETTEETPSTETEAETLPLPDEKSGEEKEETKDDVENSSLKGEPFNKNPEFIKRLEEIDNKYGSQARNWDALMKTSSPELKIQIVKALEDSGQVPKGTYDIALKQMGTPKKEKETVVKPDSIEEKVAQLPEVQYAKQLYEQKQEEERQEALEMQQIIVSFEEKHPDIAQQKNPGNVRATIATVAGLLEERDGLDKAESLEQAYNLLFNKEALISEAREKGEISGLIKAAGKDVVSVPLSTSGTSKEGLRKLTPEEESARQALGGDSAGFTRAAYIASKEGNGSVE